MTNEKQKEMIKKILEATVAGAPAKSLDGYREVAVEYVNMINEVITPMKSIYSTACGCSLRIYERYCDERIG